jgi:tetratricopeptide (TPR) repeat protein
MKKEENKVEQTESSKRRVNPPPFVPPIVIPDDLKVPAETILLVPDNNLFMNPPNFAQAGKNREWFSPYFYHCLPIVFGNQHGFLLLNTHDFVIRWSGSNGIDGVFIHMLEPADDPDYIILESHFGHGILTVQTRFTFRTPKGVNLLIKEPPNYPHHGLSWMAAVVEADNLRRDFTFNIKMTQPHVDVFVPKGTPLGCVIPYPRYFIDKYKMSVLTDEVALQKAQQTVDFFSKERGEFDDDHPRHRYMEGIDIFNIPFQHHQKTLDSGKWWSYQKKEFERKFSKNGSSNGGNPIVGLIASFRRLFANGARKTGPTEYFVEGPDGTQILATPDARPLVRFGQDNGQTQHDELKANGQEGAISCPANKSEAKTKQEHNQPVSKDGAVQTNDISNPKDLKKILFQETDYSRSNDFSEIIELNADLPDSTLTLFLPPEFDRAFLPVRGEKLRDWWEKDKKTTNHAKFCLPLTMGAAVGWYILSPATFTVEWDGDNDHDAQITVEDGAASHAIIDNHSAHGAFTVQACFIPRTKRPGDFVYIKGIANQYRLPYQFMEAMIEAWWNPAQFGLVALLNQPGKFTIKKGEPIAQMFVISADQASYGMEHRDEYPPKWREWDAKRSRSMYIGKDLDYLRGLWPDETPVCPHFKTLHKKTNIAEALAEQEKTNGAKIPTPKVSPDTSAFADLIQTTEQALNAANYVACESAVRKLIEQAKKEHVNSVELIQCLHDAGNFFLNESPPKSEEFLKVALDFVRRLPNPNLTMMADICHDLGMAERYQAKAEPCEKHFREALEIRKAIGAKEETIGHSMFCLGSLYDYMQRYEESEPLIIGGLEIKRRLLGEKDPSTIFALNGLACLYTHTHRFDESKKLFDQAIAYREELMGKVSPEVADSLNDVGFLYREKGDLKMSAEYFAKALAIREELYGVGAWETAEFLENLAHVLGADGQLAKSRDTFDRLEAIWEKHGKKK